MQRAGVPVRLIHPLRSPSFASVHPPVLSRRPASQPGNDTSTQRAPQAEPKAMRNIVAAAAFASVPQRSCLRSSGPRPSSSGGTAPDQEPRKCIVAAAAFLSVPACVPRARRRPRCGVPARHYWRTRTPLDLVGTVSASVWTQLRHRDRSRTHPQQQAASTDAGRPPPAPGIDNTTPEPAGPRTHLSPVSTGTLQPAPAATARPPSSSAARRRPSRGARRSWRTASKRIDG